MAKANEVPPFIPKADNEPMVVMTVRIKPKQKEAINLMWRQNAKYTSVSHVIQTAIDEFLAKHA